MPIVEDIPQIEDRRQLREYGGGFRLPPPPNPPGLIIEDATPPQAAAQGAPGLIIEDRAPQSEQSWGNFAAATGARIVPPLAAIPFGPFAVAGAAAGGELLGQAIEGQPLNLKTAALEGALAPIPLGKAARFARGPVSTAATRGVQAGAFGAAAELPREYLRSGEAPSLEQMGKAGALSAAFGVPFGAVEGIAGARRAARAPGLPTAEQTRATGLIIEDLVSPAQEAPAAGPASRPPTGQGVLDFTAQPVPNPQAKAAAALRKAADELEGVSAPQEPAPVQPEASAAAGAAAGALPIERARQDRAQRAIVEGGVYSSLSAAELDEAQAMVRRSEALAAETAFRPIRSVPAPEPATRSLADQAASPEAISRIQGEKARGVTYFRQKNAGARLEPMPATVDRVDIQPRASEVIYRQDPDGMFHVERTPAGMTQAQAQQRLAGLQARQPPISTPEPPPLRPKPATIPSKAPTRTLEGPAGRDVEAFGTVDPTRRFQFRFRAADLDSLEVNAPETQPRNRGRATSTAQVNQLAGEFDPQRFLAGNEELDRGVPIVGPDAKVESGNGRTLALRQLRDRNPEAFQRFIATQKARAAEFGLTPDDIGPNTVIVRERVTDVPDRLAFAEEANARTGLASAPSELAQQDARRLPPDAVAALHVGETQTVDQALTSPTNRSVVTKFLSSFPPNERAGLTTADAAALNPTGVQRLKAALLGNAYRGEKSRQLIESLTETSDSNIRNLEQAIFSSIGKVAKVGQLVRDGVRDAAMDFSDDVVAVANKLSQLRREGTKVEDYLAQPSFAPDMTPFQDELLDVLSTAGKSAVRMRRILNALADEVIAAPAPGQGSMFGTKPMSKEDLLANAMRRAGETGLFGEVGAAGRGQKRRRRIFGGRPSINDPEPPPPPRTMEQLEALPPERRTVEALEEELGKQRGALSRRDPDQLAPSLTARLEEGSPARELIDETATALRDRIEFERRGVRPVRVTRQEADALGLTVDDLRQRMRGDPANAEKMQAILDLSHKLTIEAEVAGARATRTGNPQDYADFVRRMLALEAVLPQKAGAAAELGRGLHILRQAKHDTDDAGLGRLLKTVGGLENSKELVRRFMLIPRDNLAARNKFIIGAIRHGMTDKALELYYASLLSGPQTQIVNALSNAVMTAERPALKVGQVAFDILRASATGTPRERFLGEVGADLLGMQQGFRHGTRAFLNVLINELPPEAASKILERGVRPRAIEGLKGRIVRSPMTLMEASDEFFKAVNYWGSLHALAFRQAAKEGVTGRARLERMAELVNRPSAVAGLEEAAASEALYRVFQKPLGEIGEKVFGLRNAISRYGKIGHLIAPFVMTPVNVAKVGVERSPLALVSMAMRFREGSLRGADLGDELARAAIGTALGAGVVAMVKDDLITGFGPVDAEKRQAWRAAGKQPYSFKIPKWLADRFGMESQWVNYGRLEPFGITVGLAADFGELIEKTELQDAISKIGFLFGKNLSSKTFLRGLSGFMNAVEDPDRYGEQFLEGFAGSLIPNLVAQAARITDPTLRKPGTAPFPRSIAQVLRSRLPITPDTDVPGLGKASDITPIRDLFGEEVVRVGGPAERFLNPFARTIISQDRARQEVERLELEVGTPRRQLGDITLDDDMYDRYVMASGKKAKEKVDRLVRTPFYAGLNDAKKTDVLQDAFTDARAEARELIKSRLGRRRAAGGLR